MLVGWSLSGKV